MNWPAPFQSRMPAPRDLDRDLGAESPPEYFKGMWVGMALGSIITAGFGVILFLK
jgi:hypothetical protein